MTSKGVRRGKSHEDILSKLPREVICYILVKMPIRDAIRTSVLSKNWRSYYLSIPELVFDDQFCKDLKHIARKKSRIFIDQFDETVTKSLLLHPRPSQIERFEVCFPDFKSSRVLDVNKWLLYLSGKNIKKLTLENTDYYNKRLKLPPYFFSCLGLTHLKLQNFVLSPPLEFEGFQILDHLILTEVDLPNNCFESFLSGCPVLERLELLWCKGILHFDISSSNLKSLVIKDTDEFKSICLADAPNLTEVSVTLGSVKVQQLYPVSGLVMFMETLPKVRKLHLNGKFLKTLAVAGDEVPSKLPFDLNCVKLELSGFDLDELYEVKCVLCLIRSFQYLQYMEIEVVDNYDGPPLASLEECFSDVTCNQLREVKLDGITGTEAQMKLTKLLLVKSPVLERLLIEPCTEDEHADDIIKIYAQLTKFQRASPKAEVVYNLDKHRYYGR